VDLFYLEDDGLLEQLQIMTHSVDPKSI
jgi:hypothetical protein